MKIDILTLFPKMYDGFLSESIIKRAIEKSKVEINIHDLRSYSDDKNKKVDDYQFGGGGGMILMPQPVFDAIEDLKKDNTKVIMMTPQGERYNQSLAYDLSNEDHIILLCGHYEGFDERIRTIVDMEISIGDYVLTGGEIPSMVITDSVVRLLDDVITNESLKSESFTKNKLDYPVYTKPREFRGMEVPEVLLSGNHKEINEYREKESIKRTLERRPDLLGSDING